MIEVERLRKVYGEFEALRGISFSVSKGEVVGFLGPNGAGKTTTLRILTGFIPPTSGKAVVANFDVFDDSLEVRKRLGYLPESVPLYPEMRVEEFLKFRAALKRIPVFERKANIDRVIEQCWLSDARWRIIGHLSKGFRQRVGLADALLGSPEVLVLDEPTVGLDPNQVRETRQLIKSLAQMHTVILSTHILHEVEMICNRVIIIHQGRIVADDTQEGLVESMSDSRRLLIELRNASTPAVEELLNATPGVARWYVAEHEGIVKVEVEQDRGVDLRETLSAAFVSMGCLIRELRSERFTLEDIFAHLTSDKYVEPDRIPVEAELAPAPIPEAEPAEPEAEPAAPDEGEPETETPAAAAEAEPAPPDEPPPAEAPPPDAERPPAPSEAGAADDGARPEDDDHPREGGE